MKNSFVINVPSGPIKMCSVFDFVSEVKRQLLPKHYEEIAIHQKKHFMSSKFRYNNLDYTEVAKTLHTLKLNPMKLLTELKKTTTQLYRESKDLTLDELIYDTSNLSAREFGVPTNFFCIGEDLYCLASNEDVVLFVNEGYKQQLVCTRPERNFTIYAPNLKMEF